MLANWSDRDIMGEVTPLDPFVPFIEAEESFDVRYGALEE